MTERAFAGVGARRGVTPPRQPGGRTGFLDDVLVELGFIDQATADWAVQQGRVRGETTGAVFVESRILTEDQLSRAIAELHGLDHVDLDAFGVDLDVAQLISRQAARRYKAVPIAADADGSVIVALADPVDPLAVSDVAVMIKSEVKPMVATESQIDAVIAHLHDAPGAPGSAAGNGQLEPSVSDHQGVPERDHGPIVETEPAPQPEPQPEIESDPVPEAPSPQPPAPESPSGEFADELSRASSALDQLAARLESYSPHSPELEAERDTLRELVESGNEERERLREELEGAERRTQAANASMTQLREEGDRDRERQRKAAEELRAELDEAKESNRRLQQRLDTVLEATAEIRAVCEKLIGPSNPRN